MAAAIIASVCFGNRRIRPSPPCILVGPSGGQDKLFAILPAVTKKKITALLADGDGFCRVLQQGLLHHHGVETVAVDNGQTAIDLLASGATFSLVILDFSLPRLCGLEVTRRIRAMSIPTKIIGMTIQFGLSEIEAFMEAGANLVIEKPLLSETLVPILMELAHEP